MGVRSLSRLSIGRLLPDWQGQCLLASYMVPMMYLPTHSIPTTTQFQELNEGRTRACSICLCMQLAYHSATLPSTCFITSAACCCRAPRLAPAPQPVLRPYPAIDSRRTALISGGTKGLGLEMAKNAAAGGQKTLVLMSRKPAMSQAQLAELVQQGTAVFVVKCDAGISTAMAEVQRWVGERLPAVQTYAHAAGALGYDIIPDVTPQSFLDVTRAKVRHRVIARTALPSVIEQPSCGCCSDAL
jgi:KR domain